MATLNFPTSPTEGQTYTLGTKTWSWNGTAWQLLSNASGGGTITVTDDTSTNADTYYPSMVYNQTSGVVTGVYTASTELYFNPSTGTLNSTVFNSLSDITQKTNITPITDPMLSLWELDGVEFEWIKSGNKSAGVIAQQVEVVLPWLVNTNPDTGIKSVNYSGLTAYLLEVVKQHERTIADLEIRLQRLESK